MSSFGLSKIKDHSDKVSSLLTLLCSSLATKTTLPSADFSMRGSKSSVSNIGPEQHSRVTSVPVRCVYWSMSLCRNEKTNLDDWRATLTRVRLQSCWTLPTPFPHCSRAHPDEIPLQFAVFRDISIDKTNALQVAVHTFWRSRSWPDRTLGILGETRRIQPVTFTILMIFTEVWFE